MSCTHSAPGRLLAKLLTGQQSAARSARQDSIWVQARVHTMLRKKSSGTWQRKESEQAQRQEGHGSTRSTNAQPAQRQEGQSSTSSASTRPRPPQNSAGSAYVTNKLAQQEVLTCLQ